MKYLLIILASIGMLIACQDPAPNKEFESSNFDLISLTDGVFACIHKTGGKAICNAGIIDNGKETIVFDCFLSPAVAAEIPEVIQAYGLSPIRYVINSHFHNDHIRGNQVFAEDVKIISTRTIADLIAEMEPEEIAAEKEYAPSSYAMYDSLYHHFSGDTTSLEYREIMMWRPYYKVLAESYQTVKTRLPDIFMDSLMHLDGPQRKLQLISRGPGHTQSDIILYLPDDQIVFTGDLVFNQNHPYLAHGEIAPWKSWLDFMNTLDIQKVIPGHGPLGNKDIISQMKDYIVNIEELATQLQKQEMEPEELAMPEKYMDWMLSRFFPVNLQFVASID